ncbi:hypothetical protein ASA1KI_42360 [Opitutales bacterium ASA1]|nr:hypothetical protein ASA1KI_42360 [Opitutales bacterium ASA1]
MLVHGLGRNDPARRRNRWIVASLIAGTAHAVGFFAFRVPIPVRIVEEPRVPLHAWAGDSATRVGTLLDEQLLLFDNAPLFLPTEWNAASSDAVRPIERSPTDLFGSFPDRLQVPGARVPDVVPLLPPSVEAPYRALHLSRLDASSALGRTDRDLQPLADRTAAIVVRDGFTGVVRDSFDVSVEPETVRTWPDWEPMELLVHTDRAGWVPPPLVSRGSGSTVVDGFFRTYVRERLRADLRFGAGFYRIEIGP